MEIPTHQDLIDLTTSTISTLQPRTTIKHLLYILSLVQSAPITPSNTNLYRNVFFILLRGFNTKNKHLISVNSSVIIAIVEKFDFKEKFMASQSFIKNIGTDNKLSEKMVRGLFEVSLDGMDGEVFEKYILKNKSNVELIGASGFVIILKKINEDLNNIGNSKLFYNFLLEISNINKIISLSPIEYHLALKIYKILFCANLITENNILLLLSSKKSGISAVGQINLMETLILSNKISVNEKQKLKKKYISFLDFRKLENFVVLESLRSLNNCINFDVNLFAELNLRNKISENLKSLILYFESADKIFVKPILLEILKLKNLKNLGLQNEFKYFYTTNLDEEIKNLTFRILLKCGDFEIIQQVIEVGEGADTEVELFDVIRDIYTNLEINNQTKNFEEKVNFVKKSLKKILKNIKQLEKESKLEFIRLLKTIFDENSLNENVVDLEELKKITLHTICEYMEDCEDTKVLADLIILLGNIVTVYSSGNNSDILEEVNMKVCNQMLLEDDEDVISSAKLTLKKIEESKKGKLIDNMKRKKFCEFIKEKENLLFKNEIKTENSNKNEKKAFNETENKTMNQIEDKKEISINNILKSSDLNLMLKKSTNIEYISEKNVYNLNLELNFRKELNPLKIQDWELYLNSDELNLNLKIGRNSEINGEFIKKCEITESDSHFFINLSFENLKSIIEKNDIEFYGALRYELTDGDDVEIEESEIEDFVVSYFDFMFANSGNKNFVKSLVKKNEAFVIEKSEKISNFVEAETFLSNLFNLKNTNKSFTDDKIVAKGYGIIDEKNLEIEYSVIDTKKFNNDGYEVFVEIGCGDEDIVDRCLRSIV